jgi:hypothetical protein
MPLYAVQARTMMGDVVPMAAFAMAFCGAMGALLEVRSRRVAGAWLALSALGVVAGYLARGALFGVALPAGAVALTYLVLLGAGTPEDGARWHPFGDETSAPPWARRLALWLGAGAALGAVAAAWFGVAALSSATPDVLSRAVGFAVRDTPPAASTFELTLRELGHGAFPWSALLPFAIGRTLWLRRTDAPLLVSLLVGCGSAYGVHAWLAPHGGVMPFVATPLLAALVALALWDLGRGASLALGAGTAVLTAVLWRDFDAIPHKALVVFGIDDASMPLAFQAQGGGWLLLASALFVTGVALTWMDAPTMLGDPEPLGRAANPALRDWLRARLEHHEANVRTLASIWRGNLVFGFLVVEAALVGLGAMLIIGRRFGWASVTAMSEPIAKVGVNLWWFVPLALLMLPLAFEGARILFAWASGRARLGRQGAMLVVALLAGASISFGYYPAVADQLSMKDIFASYGRLHAPGEPLGVFGLSARAGRYYSDGEDIVSFDASQAALRWLVGDAASRERRWLVFRDDDLGRLNASYRQQRGVNLPVVDAKAGEILLASNLLADAANDNPLERVVAGHAPPSIQHPLAITFSDVVEALGYDVVDERGALADALSPGLTYQLRLHYRVLKAPRRNYSVFVHIDGGGRRHNADHEVLGGAYRMPLWRPGDVITDVCDVTLEPNFMPGSYGLYFGFYAGGERLPVTRGKHHDNRAHGGTLHVR